MLSTFLATFTGSLGPFSNERASQLILTGERPYTGVSSAWYAGGLYANHEHTVEERNVVKLLLVYNRIQSGGLVGR